MSRPSITPFLWFDNNLEEAVAFYRSIFPDTELPELNRAGADGPVVGGEFTLQGQRFLALNGGPAYRFNEAVSMFVSVQTQDDIDHYWTALIADGGAEGQCGWLKDKFGLSWQIVPQSLGDYLGGSDPHGAARAVTALRGMRKLVIADLESAYRGATD